MGWFQGVGWLRSGSMRLDCQIEMRVPTPHGWAGSGLLRMIELNSARMAHGLLSNWNSGFLSRLWQAMRLSMLRCSLVSQSRVPMAQRLLHNLLEVLGGMDRVHVEQHLLFLLRALVPVTETLSRPSRGLSPTRALQQGSLVSGEAKV